VFGLVKAINKCRIIISKANNLMARTIFAKSRFFWSLRSWLGRFYRVFNEITII
jgi:hypothetical protein